MAGPDAPVTLLDCPLPAVNNIDVPAEIPPAQKEAALKEAKSSLRFAVLRSLRDTPGAKKLFMVLPMPSRADQVCVAEIGSQRVQVVNKSLKSLANHGTGHEDGRLTERAPPRPNAPPT